ncbi:hypothetical protein Y032_0007g3392 [Ancylostoma ceylanicum]|uniref:Uncharacterized protein n=1 Tax=Ancylostoma ceylanicum TaxID=53326 RepID=A0A016VN47_9BILA|nr:hypothetical protein Y032_0007g3392 [Ancylostoma ceylanicum]
MRKNRSSRIAVAAQTHVFMACAFFSLRISCRHAASPYSSSYRRTHVSRTMRTGQDGMKFSMKRTRGRREAVNACD